MNFLLYSYIVHVDKDVRWHILHDRLRKTVTNLDLVTQCSLFYCTSFMGIFTRSGSKLQVMKD